MSDSPTPEEIARVQAFLNEQKAEKAQAAAREHDEARDVLDRAAAAIRGDAMALLNGRDPERTAALGGRLAPYCSGLMAAAEIVEALRDAR